MNVHHLAQNWFKPWRCEDDQALLDMLAEGSGYRNVAQSLGRTLSGVHMRAKKLRVRLRPPSMVKPKPPLLITIPRANLIDYYANGWRVQGFDETSCLMLWPHKGEARYPR